MLKNYELLYIVHPDLEGTTDKVTDKVSGFISKIEGTIINQEDWGKRKLAYPIAHNDFGVFVLVEFTAEAEKLNDLERNLRLSEEVMRSMVVTLPEEKETHKRSKPAKKTEDAEEVKEVEKKPKTEKAEAKAVEEKPAKKTVVEKEEKPKKAVKKEDKAKEKVSIQDEKDRLKQLDEKLEELLGEDKK